MAIDWSILCCCRNVDICVDSGYPTEPTGYFQLLPREHLSDAYWPEWINHFNFSPFFSTPLLSTKPRSLGQRALVHELGDQPYLCPPCNAPAAMGATISQDHSVPPVHSTQTSADPCVLFRRYREVSPAMDRRCLAHASPRFPLPVLCRPCCVPLPRQSHNLQIAIVVGRPLRDSLWVHDLHANNSS